MDEVPLPFPILASIAPIDVERVEVLKGPQGTLFGQNSTGGAINYIAAKPTDMFQAGGTFTYGRFNDALTEAFVSGPISSTLKGRLAVSGETGGDWQRSYTRSDGLGEKRKLSVRPLLNWNPTEKLALMLSGGCITLDRQNNPTFTELASTHLHIHWEVSHGAASARR